MSNEPVVGSDQNLGTPVEDQSLVQAVRARILRERVVSSSNGTDSYAAASLGQSPYVSLPNVGIVIVQRRDWTC